MSSFENICRVCVQQSQSKLTFIEDLIEYREKKISIKDVLRFFIPDKLLTNKDYPQFICEKCLSAAKTVLAFKIKCDESYILLQELWILAKNKQDDTSQTASEPEVKHDLVELIKVEIDMENYHEEGTNYLCDSDNRTKEQVDNNGQQIRNDERSTIPVNGEQRGSSGVTTCWTIKPEERTDGVYVCPYCPKTFSYKYNFSAHKKRHERKDRYRCVVCSKGFCCQSDLTRHTRIHTGEKNFECNTCNKRFISSNNLNLHMRTHTGIRPFLCTTCGKSFTHQAGLNYHMRTHNDERPYPCDMCSRKFKMQNHLDRHKKTHSGPQIKTLKDSQEAPQIKEEVKPVVEDSTDS